MRREIFKLAYSACAKRFFDSKGIVLVWVESDTISLCFDSQMRRSRGEDCSLSN